MPKLHFSGHLYWLIPAAGFALISAGGADLLLTSKANALPAYAQQTGLPCGRCHTNPAGGGPRTAFGNAFAANGHKVPSKKK